MNRLRLPRRLKVRIWRLRDQIRAPKLSVVPPDADPLYEMLAATPAWARRQVLIHGAARRRVAPELVGRRRAG
jgi:hypothetical protein